MNPKTDMDIPRFPAFPQDRIEVWAATVTLGGAKRWSRVDLAIFAGIWTSISPCYPRVLVGVILRGMKDRLSLFSEYDFGRDHDGLARSCSVRRPLYDTAEAPFAD